MRAQPLPIAGVPVSPPRLHGQFTSRRCDVADPAVASLLWLSRSAQMAVESTHGERTRRKFRGFLPSEQNILELGGHVVRQNGRTIIRRRLGKVGAFRTPALAGGDLAVRQLAHVHVEVRIHQINRIGSQQRQVQHLGGPDPELGAPVAAGLPPWRRAIRSISAASCLATRRPCSTNAGNAALSGLCRAVLAGQLAPCCGPRRHATRPDVPGTPARATCCLAACRTDSAAAVTASRSPASAPPSDAALASRRTRLPRRAGASRERLRSPPASTVTASSSAKRAATADAQRWSFSANDWATVTPCADPENRQRAACPPVTTTGARHIASVTRTG